MVWMFLFESQVVQYKQGNSWPHRASASLSAPGHMLRPPLRSHNAPVLSPAPTLSCSAHSVLHLSQRSSL
uniref:Uncharacterized protein n=1 Tax=Knipowitschia caucasica TaxID=637954 RepID=A0AAV2LMG8_KNICA